MGNTPTHLQGAAASRGLSQWWSRYVEAFTSCLEFTDKSVDGATFVYVPDCSKATRLEQGEPVKDVEDIEVDVPVSTQASDEESEETEHARQEMLTPASSTITSLADRQHMQGHNIATNSNSSSFSHQDGDVTDTPGPIRRLMAGYDDSFDPSMTGEMMEQGTTNNTAYAHHKLAQSNYSHLPVPLPQYPQQPMHPAMEHHETQRWVDFNPDTINRVSHAGGPVQPESMMTGYSVFSNADMGAMAANSNSLPCTEDFYQSQARMEQMHRHLQHQNFDPGLSSQPSRDIPYRIASTQTAQQMPMRRHDSYDDNAVLHSSFYHHM